jgi:hypothetical protein
MSEGKNKNTSEVSKKKHFVSKRHRYAVIFFVVFLLGLGCFLLWRFLQSPAVGTIRLGELPTVTESFDVSKEKKRYSGKYFDFSYVVPYVEKRHELPINGPIKESVFLSAEDVEGRKIALVLADRGTSDLTSDPSFQVRSDARGGYRSKTFAVGAFRGILFQKNTQIFEATAFFLYQGQIMSISITSPFDEEGLEAELSDIVESLRLTLD